MENKMLVGESVSALVFIFPLSTKSSSLTWDCDGNRPTRRPMQRSVC